MTKTPQDHKPEDTASPHAPPSLSVALRRLGVERDPGDVGEGSIDRKDRERHNEAVDVVLSALAAAPIEATIEPPAQERATLTALGVPIWGIANLLDKMADAGLAPDGADDPADLFFALLEAVGVTPTDPEWRLKLASVIEVAS